MLTYALAFLAGIIVKAVDWLDDVKKSTRPAKYILSLLYGLLLGYIIGTSTFSVIFLAALVAQVFARKVDTTAHRMGFVTAALSLIYFGFPVFDIWLFLIFLFLAFLDEIDYIGWLRPITEYRPFLKVGALIPAISGVWDCFIGIMAFDIGYELFKIVIGERKEREK